eukprot:Skav207592  [mRNA]  locus=scaffold2450:94965:97961:+ [translate_table: standard]
MHCPLRGFFRSATAIGELLHYLARGELDPEVLAARAQQRVERGHFQAIHSTETEAAEEFYRFLDHDGDGIDMYEFMDYVHRIKRTKKSLGSSSGKTSLEKSRDQDLDPSALQRLASLLKGWEVNVVGTEGYPKAMGCWADLWICDIPKDLPLAASS